MRVLVCGSRDWTDRKRLYQVLDQVHVSHDITAVIEGEARGADKMARGWAASRNIAVAAFPADWNRYKLAAGPIRNRQMLIEGKPELIVAFHDDLPHSKGTRNMITQAMKAGLPVLTFTTKGSTLTPTSKGFSLTTRPKRKD